MSEGKEEKKKMGNLNFNRVTKNPLKNSNRVGQAAKDAEEI
jgi:hypothetical protein